MNAKTIRRKIPFDLYYSETHEWVSLDDIEATIGMTFFGAQEAGEISHLELPEVGDEFDQFDQFGAFEGENNSGDFQVPVSGRVIAVNDITEENPKLINQDPYGGGWLIKLEATQHEDDLEQLMDPNDYEENSKSQ